MLIWNKSNKCNLLILLICQCVCVKFCLDSCLKFIFLWDCSCVYFFDWSIVDLQCCIDFCLYLSAFWFPLLDYRFLWLLMISLTHLGVLHVIKKCFASLILDKLSSAVKFHLILSLISYIVVHSHVCVGYWNRYNNS